MKKVKNVLDNYRRKSYNNKSRNLEQGWLMALVENKSDYNIVVDNILDCEKRSAEHKELLAEEFRLLTKGLKIREKLGILAKDPCNATMRCFHNCSMTVKGFSKNKCGYQEQLKGRNK